MEKYREKQEGLYVAFVDLEKAHDRVPKSEVWRCRRDKGVSEKYVRLVQDMYDGVTSYVNSCIGTTEEFEIKVGLHQGSALSPYLFDLIMDVISDGVRSCAPWESCLLMTSRWCHGWPPSLPWRHPWLMCETKPELRRQLSRWKTALEEKSFKISRMKTEYLKFNDYEDLDDMKMDEEIIKKVQAYKYLGMRLGEDGELDVEISHRIRMERVGEAVRRALRRENEC